VNKFVRFFLSGRASAKSLLENPGGGIITSLRVVGLVLAIALSCVSSWAQKDTGVIAGTVKDASGGVVAGARVRVVDVDRGTEFDTSTEANGEYVAGPLKVGRYTITVEKAGFKSAVAGPVQLDVQGRIEADVKLEVGQVSQKVEVTVQNPLLETETSTMGEVMDKTRIETLPLNGRNFAQLAQLGAGVVPSEPGSRISGNYGFSVDGARSLQNNFLLDGIDNNSNLGDAFNEASYVIQPPVDAIEEFKVQTNDYSAEFGRGNGAILNAVIKSGTNAFHGDVFEYFRNDVLDASPFFIVNQKPAYKQNQFGGTIGGPIKKDKTFLFADYEGFRLRQGIPQTATIPDQSMVNGDFSELLTNTPAMAIDPNSGNPTGAVALDCSGNQTFVGEIFNARQTQVVPVTLANPSGLCGTPIGVGAGGVPTNIFPTGSTDPLASRLAALIPAPNSNNPAFNYIAVPVRSENRNNFDVRIDHTISNKDSLFGRFSYEKQPSFIPSPFQNVLDGGGFFDGNEDFSYRSVALSETHVIDSTHVNEFRFGYNRINAHRYQNNFDENVSANLDFPGVPFQPGTFNGGLPALTFSDGSAPQLGSSGYLPSIEKQNSYVITDNFTWVKGRHSIKVGTELRFEQFTLFQPSASRGTADFSTGFTDNPAAPGSGGNGFATFLLGISDGGSIVNLHNVDYHRQIYAGFIQDDFKASSRLTLNLGLRYEYYSPVKAAGNEQANFNFACGCLIVPTGQTAELTPTLATQISIDRTGSTGLVSPDYHNFAPRVGLAYKISDKLVLRTSYGIFYGGQENGPYSNPSPGFNPPFFVTQSFNQPCLTNSANPGPPPQIDCSIPGFNSLQQGFPANSLVDPNTPLLFSISPNITTPFMQQWFLGFQYELPSNMVAQVSYVGSHGANLFGMFNGNQAVPTADPNSPTAGRRPDPNIDTGIETLRSNLFSNYNGLQLRLEKRFSNGLQFSAAYTYSHALDDASSASLGSQNQGDFRLQTAPYLEYGNADFDVRHRFVVNFVYNLPFGNGQHFGSNLTGVANQLVANWQVTGIVSAQTGNWFTATDDVVNISNSDCGGEVFNCARPNVVGNPNGAHCEAGTLFNTCAFVPNGELGTFGDAGRNIIRGPGLQNWDLSFIKQFPVKEQMHFEFRAEFFNIWNHPNLQFADPTTTNENFSTERGASQFGFATASLAPRLVQFALKFYF